MKYFFALLGSLLLAVNLAFADEANSPIGTWITISDKTHDRAAVVSIEEQNGKLYGKVLKIYPGSGRNPNAVCDKCPSPFTDKPVIGLVFLWDFVPAGQGKWTQGQILDTKTGHIYKAVLTLQKGGKELQVRGYWGIFWRTQVWTRA